MKKFAAAVHERTGGRVSIQSRSYSESDISGFDMILRIRDGRVREIYGGFVGVKFPEFDVVNLWGLG